MKSREQFIKHLLDNPDLTGGRTSLRHLEGFIYGFDSGLRLQGKRDPKRSEFWLDFREHLVNEFGIHTEHGVMSIILLATTDDKSAFESFTRLFNEFHITWKPAPPIAHVPNPKQVITVTTKTFEFPKTKNDLIQVVCDRPGMFIGGPYVTSLRGYIDGMEYSYKFTDDSYDWKLFSTSFSRWLSDKEFPGHIYEWDRILLFKKSTEVEAFKGFQSYWSWWRKEVGDEVMRRQSK